MKDTKTVLHGLDKWIVVEFSNSKVLLSPSELARSRGDDELGQERRCLGPGGRGVEMSLFILSRQGVFQSSDISIFPGILQRPVDLLYCPVPVVPEPPLKYRLKGNTVSCPQQM